MKKFRSKLNLGIVVRYEIPPSVIPGELAEKRCLSSRDLGSGRVGARANSLDSPLSV